MAFVGGSILGPVTNGLDELMPGSAKLWRSTSGLAELNFFVEKIETGMKNCGKD